MKKYVCVQVDHHANISDVINRYQIQGWRLHTYQAAHSTNHNINHYLLFESIRDDLAANQRPRPFSKKGEA